MPQRVHRAILFRFHREFRVCANRIALLRRYNPSLKIHGLFGGSIREERRAQLLDLDSCWTIPIDDPVWKWLHGDLAARWWFRSVGHRFRFDMLHIVEWDLVLTRPIAVLFAHVTDGVAISELQPLQPIVDRWYWTAPRRGRWEWDALRAHVRKRYRLTRRKYWAGIFPGACLSREFLERYARETIPGWCNDEVRVPLYAQAFGMTVRDTRLSNPYVNAMGRRCIPTR